MEEFYFFSHLEHLTKRDQRYKTIQTLVTCKNNLVQYI